MNYPGRQSKYFMCRDFEQVNYFLPYTYLIDALKNWPLNE